VDIDVFTAPAQRDQAFEKEDAVAKHLASPNSALGDAAPLDLMGNYTSCAILRSARAGPHADARHVRRARDGCVKMNLKLPVLKLPARVANAHSPMFGMN
jgi:3-deoxy-D-arabino-heptulosonate 7-phosphate (DAHP) synthase